MQSLADSLDDNLQETTPDGDEREHYYGEFNDHEEEMKKGRGEDEEDEEDDGQDPELFGLKHVGWGRFAAKDDSDNKVIAKKIDGKLVKVEPKKDEPKKGKVAPKDIGQLDLPLGKSANPAPKKEEPQTYQKPELHFDEPKNMFGYTEQEWRKVPPEKKAALNMARAGAKMDDPYAATEPPTLSHRGDHPVDDKTGEYRPGQGNYSKPEPEIRPLKSPEEWQSDESYVAQRVIQRLGGLDKAKQQMTAYLEKIKNDPDIHPEDAMKAISHAEAILNTIYDEEMAASGQEERDNAVDPYINQKW